MVKKQIVAHVKAQFRTPWRISGHHGLSKESPNSQQAVLAQSADHTGSIWCWCTPQCRTHNRKECLNLLISFLAIMKLHSEMYILKPLSSFTLTQLLPEAVGEPVCANDQLLLLLLGSPLAMFALVGWSEPVVQFSVNTLIVPIYFVSFWFLKGTKSMRRKWCLSRNLNNKLCYKCTVTLIHHWSKVQIWK